MSDNYDPWEEAQNAKQAPKTYFGKVEFDIYPAVLEKGVGAVPYDPALHKDERRVTAIDCAITPLASSSASFTSERRMVAEFGDWPKIVIPSINALGVNLRELHGKWVRYATVGTGRKYTDKTGNERESTTFRFLAWYPTEEAAEAAAMALYSHDNGNGEDAPTPQPVPTEASSERANLAAFLPAFVTQANGDRDKLAQILAGHALMAKHFDINSPEVLALFPF